MYKVWNELFKNKVQSNARMSEGDSNYRRLWTSFMWRPRFFLTTSAQLMDKYHRLIVLFMSSNAGVPLVAVHCSIACATMIGYIILRMPSKCTASRGFSQYRCPLWQQPTYHPGWASQTKGLCFLIFRWCPTTRRSLVLLNLHPLHPGEEHLYTIASFTRTAVTKHS